MGKKYPYTAEASTRLFAAWLNYGPESAEYKSVVADYAGREMESQFCAKCGEPLSLPMPGFEDQTVLDSLYCVGCRPEQEKQLTLRLEGEPNETGR